MFEFEDQQGVCARTEFSKLRPKLMKHAPPRAMVPGPVEAGTFVILSIALLHDSEDLRGFRREGLHGGLRQDPPARQGPLLACALLRVSWGGRKDWDRRIGLDDPLGPLLF